MYTAPNTTKVIAKKTSVELILEKVVVSIASWPHVITIRLISYYFSFYLSYPQIKKGAKFQMLGNLFL